MYKNYFTLRNGMSTMLKKRFGKTESPPSSNLYRLWLFMLLSVFSLGQTSWAQSSANYSFGTNTTGSLVDMSSGTTTAVAAGSDAARSAVTNIGFDFYFMGNLFTQFSVQEDGIVQLGSTQVAVNTYTLTGGSASNPRLGAFVADCRTGTTTGKVHYKVSGTSPNRVLTIEFLNMQLFYTSAGVAGTSTWQMQLFENGSIQYIYGAMSAVNIGASDRAPSIGFYAGSGAGNFVAVSYATHTASTTTYAANPLIPAIGPIADLNSVADGSRRVYTFTPFSAVPAAPITFSASPVGQSTMTVNWVDNSTDETFFTVGRSISPTGPFTIVGTVGSTTIAGTGSSYLLAQTGLSANTTYYYEIKAKNEGGGTSAALTASQLTSPPGNIISAATGNWADGATWVGGVAPSIFDNVTIANGHTVTINATGLGANNLTVGEGVSGVLTYGSTPSTFALTGNLTVNAGALFEVFNGTTGKSLSVAGNVTNNGEIDFSKGTGSNALTLNGTTVQTVGGSGTFTTGVIRNITFNNTATATPSINWNFNNISVGGTLTFTAGRVSLGSNKLTLGTGTATGTGAGAVGSLSYASGGFINGTFVRNWTAAGTGSSLSAGNEPSATNATSRYPFVSASGQQRSAFVERTGGLAAGQLSCTYVDAATSSTVSIADELYTVNKRYDGNWTFSTEGSTYAANTQEVLLLGNGAYQGYVISNGNSRIVLATASSGGTHQNGTTTPAAQRVLTTAELTAGPLYMGIATADLQSFVTSIASGNWNDASTWDKGSAPTCDDIINIASGHTVTVNAAGSLSKNVNINSGGILTIASGDLTVGCTLKNNALINNGTLNISGGTLTLNGRFDMNNGANLNQSGGSFVVDGNDAGIVANSVASGTPIFRIGNSSTAYSTGTIVLSGGEIVIVDPHTATTNTSGYALYVYFPSGFNIEAAAAHTFKFGNGVSTDAGGNSSGFYTDTYVNSGRLNFGNLIINNPSGTNRDFVSPYTIGINGNLNVMAGNFAPSAMILKGNLNVEGTYIATGLLTLAQPSGTGSVVNTTAQAIGVTSPGVIKNLAASDTANLSSLTVNNSAGVTLNTPISASGTITLTAGLVNTTAANLLTAGTATAAGTVSGGSATAYVNGPLSIVIASGNSSYVNYPVGKATYAPIALSPTTTAVSKFKAETFDSNSGSADISIVALSGTRRWEANFVSGTYTDMKVRLTDASLVSTSIPVQAPSAAGSYSNAFGSLATYAAGPPATTQSNTAIAAANYTGFISYADSNVCSGTPAPGNTLATATQICLGTSVTFSLQNTTPGTGVTYVWESSTNGVDYTPIADATGATYSVVPTQDTYYRAQVTCSGNTTASTAAHITFTSSVTGTTPATRCGTGTASLEATGSVGTTIKWYDAATGGTLLATGSPFTTPVISANTTYYASAESSIAGSLSIGAGASTSSAAAMPFNGGYGSLKGQYMVTAAELTAAGLRAGNITSLALDFTTTGGAFLNFEMSIGTTAMSAFPSPANIQGGLTTVYTNASFVPTVGVNNFAFGTGTGAASFNWDGSSNIIVSICWTFGASATSGTGATLKTDTYSANVSQSYRKDVEGAPCAFTGATGVGTFSYTLSTARPRMIFNGQLACVSPRVAVLATVDTPPALTLSAAPVSFCSGESSTLVTLTSLASDYDVYTWLPATGVTGTSATGWTFNPTETTTYTLTASQSTGSLCGATASIVITVDPLPLAIAISPSPVVTCVDSIQQLTATGGNSMVTLMSENFNSPTNGWTTVNNSTGTGTPANAAWTLRPDGYIHSTYAVWHSNDNSQFYLTNSDAGGNGSVTATLLQSPSFSTVGYASAELKFFSYLYDNAPASTTAKVQASIDGLAWTDLQTVVAGTTNAATNFTPITVPLTAEFVNQPVVYVRFNYAGTWRYFWGIDNVSVTASKQFDLTWSPVTNLYTDATATTPYVADTNASTIYFKSSTAASAVTYTVTSESDASCVTTATVDVTVNALPSLVITDPVAVCSPATVDLTAAAVTAGSDTGLTLTYWTDAAATTAVATPSSVGAGTYYVKAVNANTCAVIAPVVVTVNALPSLVVTNPAAVCAPSTVDITAAAVTAGSGAGLTFTYWADPNATVTFPSPDAISGSGTFYIKATNANDCSVVSPVAVVVNSVIAPTGDDTQSFNDAATVADLDATGDGIQWYDAETGGELLDSSEALTDGGVYYASQTVGGCESQTRFEVTVTLVSTIIDSANLQFPGTQTINQGGSFDVYARVYDAGVTEDNGANAAISAWVGYSSTDENPNSASFTWVPANYNVQSGDNDEYSVSLGATLPVGTYYYASRFQVNGGAFAYGGYSSTGGGFWNGTTNVNGVLTVQVPTITYANLQFPDEAEVAVGETETVYARVYAQGITEAAGAGAGITAWIGYSSVDENPNAASFTWIPATFNVQADNNDEFSAAIGSGLTAGTYYYASRFELNGGGFVYGGYSATGGGFWNGTTNVNGVLTVNCGVVPPPTTTTPVQDFTTGDDLTDFDVTGTNLIWYDAATDGNVLLSSTVITTGTVYYVSQTIDGCESATRLMITAGVDLRNPGFDKASLKYYPNPVTDMLTITYSSTIDSIEIFNVLGQRVYQKAHNAQEVKIDMSSLATGNYVVNVMANGLVKNIKVIKK